MLYVEAPTVDGPWLLYLVYLDVDQPLLVLAEIEKVPDLQKTSTISSSLSISSSTLIALLLRVPAA